MIYRKPWLWIAATMLVLSACSDDAGKDKGGSNEKAGEGESCAQTADCKDNLICDNGICKAEESECDSDEACGKGMKCVEGACKPDTSKCESDEACGKGMKCVEGACKPDTSKCESDEACGEDMKCIEGTCQPKDAQTCDSDEGCASGMKCDEGVCKTIVNAGDSCNASEYCEDSVCEDGVCRVYAKAGESCDNQTYLCQTGLICSEYGTCYAPLELGEECDDIDKICNSDFFCSPEQLICLKKANYDEDCGDGSYAECDIDANLQCYDGKCRHLSQDKKCDESTVCPEKQICFENACIDKVECEDDTQCKADTYCCKDDACQTKNVCVAYGTGPRGNTNEQCQYKTVPGMFEADIQCEWSKPADDDPYPKSFNIVTPTFVAKTPHDMGLSNSLIVATYIGGDWANYDEAYKYGVIRIINPETCKVVENIYDKKNYISAGATMAIADTDGDGIVEIYAQRSPLQPDNTTDPTGGIVQFVWSKEQNKYITGWTAISALTKRTYGWGGLAVHDVNDDGVPEIINPYGEVLDAKTGTKLNGTQTIDNPLFATVGDLDNDGKVEYIANSGDVYEWSVVKGDDGKISSQSWVLEYPKAEEGGGYPLKAFGDFGTPGATAADFDWNKKDGIAEIVSTRGIDAGKGKSQIAIHALTKKVGEDGKEVKGQQRIFFVTDLFGGGAPTIGDFDKDDMPEVGVAFGDYYSVFDPRCKKQADNSLPEGCLEENYLWKQPNTDNSSYCTGSSVFDFDGDGQIEVVYADECYTRIYDGKTGDVLFSAKHSSRTAYEMPTIADVDNDQSAEIIMGANTTDRTCNTIDTIHRGIRCEVNSDCTSGICENKFCRCSEDSDCNWRKGSDGNLKEEYICTDPLSQDSATNSHKVCRAKRPQGKTISGIRVMRDRYDRWASSRNLWNQYAYSITNINDDLSIPKTSKWLQNFLDPKLNNYRANSQGALGMNVAPDITGKLDKDNLCVVSGVDNTITLTGLVCNRGTKTVGSKMPASFYQVDDDDNIIKKYCTSYTSENVPVGGCLEVSCSLSGDKLTDVTILMKVNDDGEGGRTTVECNDKNNTDKVTIASCQVN